MPKSETARTNAYVPVKSAERVMQVLEYLAESKSAPFAAIVRDLDIPNSSGHHLLSTLVDGGFIEHNAQGRTYSLGPRLWSVAQSHVRQGLADISQPFMDDLVSAVNETVQLSTLDGSENLYLAVSDSTHAMRLSTPVGSRLPAHATGLGKTLLAGLPDGEVRALLGDQPLKRFTVSTITSTEVLIQELAVIRARGYGEDNEECVIGCRCVAVPLRDATGATVAAISVTVPTPRLSPDLLARIHSGLALAATAIEAELR